MWILTEEYNDYDQHGEYFVAAWNEKPTLEKLREIHWLELFSDETLNKLLAGGGREYNEYQWYNLHEYEEGTSF